MRRTFSSLILILGLVAPIYGQSKPGPKKSATNSTSDSSLKPTQRANFLAVPFDPNQTNVGKNFRGHDIIALIEAIKKSSALKEKSEFESTSEFKARRETFAARPFYGSLTAGDYLGFVIGNESQSMSPSFKYDADSQMLTVTLPDDTANFDTDKAFVELTFDGILIRSRRLDRQSYIGSNAFGAKVNVEKEYDEVHGLIFTQDNWLFRTSKDYTREFTYQLSMPPDYARTLKDDAKLIIVCRLTDPYFRISAHGIDATISHPHEVLIGYNYLQVIPDQLWIVNSKTGKVIKKIKPSAESNSSDK